MVNEHREAEYGATSQGGFEPKISGLVLPATALQSNTGKPLKQYCGEPDYIGFLAVAQRSLSSKNVKKVSNLCNTILSARVKRQFQEIEIF